MFCASHQHNNKYGNDTCTCINTVGTHVCKQQELRITSVRISAVAAACFHSPVRMFRMSLVATDAKEINTFQTVASKIHT